MNALTTAFRTAEMGLMKSIFVLAALLAEPGLLRRQTGSLSPCKWLEAMTVQVMCARTLTSTVTLFDQYCSASEAPRAGYHA